MVINLCGRGDKDMLQVADALHFDLKSSAATH
jgi:hypothetical protein